jgi:hypothetical protein
MKDRNRFQTPLAPQGYGRPGTPGDFASSGDICRARSVHSLRHLAHQFLSIYVPPPLPISNRTQKVPEHQARTGTRTAPPPPAAAPHRPRIPPPRRDILPKNNKCSRKGDAMKKKTGGEEKIEKKKKPANVRKNVRVQKVREKKSTNERGGDWRSNGASNVLGWVN